MNLDLAPAHDPANELLSPSVRDHADRVLQAVRQGARERAGDVVAQSWSRCVNEYRLHPDRARTPPVLPRVELEARRARVADIIECARYEMTSLYQQLGDTESAVVLTDTDGVIVHMVSSPEFAAEAAPLGLRPGARWSETEAGTNGMGTCLASAAPVCVRREDHFFSKLTELTCSAVPVFDPSGEIAAVLDVTSRSSLMQQHLLVLLGMTARMIENRLLDKRFRHAHPLHFHSRPEFVYTLHEGKLALDDDGRILAANRSALFQLGVPTVAEIRARRLEDLFQTSLGDMLQRSMSASYHPVVTYRANAALRFFAVARRPAEDAQGQPARPMVPGLPAVSASLGDAGRSRPVVPARPAALSAAATATFRDPRLAHALDTGRRVIARGTPVLLCAETGAGKEVFARALHESSPHARGAFVAVNCASLPETLIESELFGYRAGAFTGAQKTGRRGKILQADGGTLFLDEIADMPLELQARLLRVLDERQVTPLGTEETHPVDFQLISASHGRLPDLVAQGRFREDLYYRLCGIELALPPLRERADKRELIRGLLQTEGGADTVLTPEAERLLMTHPFPGNIRQLRHVLRSAAALSDGTPITPEHLPSLQGACATLPMPGVAATVAGGGTGAVVGLLAGAAAGGVGGAEAAAQGADAWGDACRDLPAGQQTAASAAGAVPSGVMAAAGAAGASGSPGRAATPARPPATADDEAAAAVARLNPIQANERQVLLQMLEQYRWNVSNVAKALDVSRNTLYRKLHKLHIDISSPD
ncbi:sigma-54-dependent Fis family transcriptional regulator [Pseudaquabacterium rugosum]|uniref:Sigma 54-interacting transcriptional regulator n=1 Tax=Pseudaquabacterium rugosum TaxID=2984194 RepID=A0ABU9B9K9_9BURK